MHIPDELRFQATAWDSTRFGKPKSDLLTLSAGYYHRAFGERTLRGHVADRLEVRAKLVPGEMADSLAS